MRFLKQIIIVFSLGVILAPSVFASGFNLKSIGGVNTDGKAYGQWYHTSLQPTLSGEAPAESTVKIIVNGDEYSVNADENGNWSWTPPEALADGDNSITLTNNESEISFILTLGADNVDWDAVGSGGGETLPTVGIAAPTISLLAGGTAVSVFFFKKFTTY